MNCSHISRVKEWGFTPEHNFKATLWDCVLCGEISDVGWLGLDDNEAIDHTACDEDCFGCKARGLTFDTGDASKPIAKKQWESRLAFYKSAREQGIQPAGTQRGQVEAALNASANLGKAYDAGTMSVRADRVTKGVAKAMKETGAA